MLYTNFQILLKTSILVLMLICIGVGFGFSQSYFHSPNDTIIANATWDDVNVYNITQTHPTNDTLFFVVNKSFVSMPIGWEASLCTIGNCFTSLIDTTTMGPIVSGDNGLMSLHIKPFINIGTAIIRYTIYATNTPTQVDTLTWILTCNTPTQINEQEITTTQPIVVIKNKQLIIQNMNETMRQLTLVDISGNICSKIKLNPNQKNYPLPISNSNVYIVIIEGNNIQYKQEILIQNE